MLKEIIIITETLCGGGMERRISVLSKYFVSAGISVKIIVMSSNHTIEYDIDPSIEIIFLKSLRTHNILFRLLIRFESFLRKLFMFDHLTPYFRVSAKKLIKIISRSPEATIISFSVWVNVKTAFAAKKLLNKVVLCEVNDPYTREKIFPYIYRSAKMYFKYADAIQCQTQSVAEYYCFLKNINKYCILNPLVSELPERFSGERRKAIVNFCRLDPQKNLKLLIDSFCLLAEEYPDYVLHIFGDGILRRELHDYILLSSHYDKIKLFPWTPDIHKIIIDYKMFVISSDYEGLSNSMIEALAIGLPVISTDMGGGGARTLIEHMKNGIIVPVRDKTAMYNAMKFIIENPEKAESMSANATFLRHQLSVDNIGLKWIELLKGLEKRKINYN